MAGFALRILVAHVVCRVEVYRCRIGVTYLWLRRSASSAPAQGDREERRRP
jgi:hypothetical protein